MIHEDDLSDDEMLAVAAQGLDDPDGWGDSGMDQYDRDDDRMRP